mgnify:CR=1 FL=1|uniref:Uncharacterized protein n=1 Tax=viral metagenome TaxID=1070528 RepID=A0A6C0JQC9_9ZZZZ
MSHFGNNLNIVMSTISAFLVSCVDTLTEKIPESAKDFDYKTNTTWAYASATTFMTGFYADAYTFFVENHNVLLCIFHLVLFVDFFVRRSRLTSACMSLTKDKANVERERRLHTLARVVNEQKFEEKERLLECFQRNYSTQQKMHISIEAMIAHGTDVVETGKKLQEDQKNLSDSQLSVLQKKLKDIEEIMISGSYNDPDYLAYDGEEWTFDLLKEKAIQMELPNVNWGSKATLGFVVRTVEQLKKIGDIVEPVYPDGYETQEEEEEVEEDDKYGSDPEWVPRKRWDASDDENDEEIDHDLMATMVNMAQRNEKKLYFFETDKSKSLENLIDMNGLKCSYSYHPTPGYTLSGYQPVVQV